MVIWTLAKKELRLLARDRLSLLILVGMPLLFILLLGMLLGEGFGQKTEDSLRVSLVDLDTGLQDRHGFPGGPEDEGKWSSLVQRDLRETSRIRVELVPTEEDARRLCSEGKRPAVVVFRPTFSAQMARCSFLADGINPFYRDGVNLKDIHVDIITDPAQPIGASVINQVVQVTLMRVILPYMIGQAFEKLSSPEFMTLLLDSVPGARLLLPEQVRKALGPGIQKSLKGLFPRYNLTGKTWADLTKAQKTPTGAVASTSVYVEESGSGPIKRGAFIYQILVPSFTVLFTFCLVLPVGWLFVTERRQGTMQRLRAAPITRSQILLGKFLACYLISVVQGVILLLAGKVVFEMNWGPPDWPLWKQIVGLTPVILTTSVAAMGLALLVAVVARTEIQVALIGGLVVLLLGLISGCLIPRELLPESMVDLSHVTPHAWALDAYRQLLIRPEPGSTWTPSVFVLARSCGVLLAFGVGCTAAAWGLLRLE